jgi:DNA-binding NarL/FixJ family response regulator
MARYRVLIVDDQRDIRRVLTAGLATLPLKVEVVDVPSAEEAMLVAAHGAFDLMVTDVRLPGISGLDLIRRVKKLHPVMKTMLMTGLTDYATRQQVEAAGVDAFFYKPLDIDDFLASVQNNLGAAAVAPSIDQEQPLSQPASQPAPAEKSLAVVDRLENLRRKAVGGLAAILDIQGNVVVQAGFLTGVFERPGLPARLSGLFSSVMAVSEQLDRPDANNMFYIAGKDLYFYLASVNTSHFFVLTAEQPFSQQGADLNQWLPPELKELDLLLAGGKAPTPIPGELPATAGEEAETEYADDLSLRSLEEELAKVQVSAEDRAAVDALFSQAGKQKIQSQALDDFWDNLAEESGTLHAGDDSLTYDQARDLGLAPD